MHRANRMVYGLCWKLQTRNKLALRIRHCMQLSNDFVMAPKLGIYEISNNKKSSSVRFGFPHTSLLTYQSNTTNRIEWEGRPKVTHNTHSMLLLLLLLTATFMAVIWSFCAAAVSFYPSLCWPTRSNPKRIVCEHTTPHRHNINSNDDFFPSPDRKWWLR